MRALLDTNIMLDILCKRPHDKDGLLQLKVMQAFSDVELWTSAKSYTDLFYIMRRELGSEAAQALLEESFSWVHACSVEESDLRAALHARWEDFEDSLVYVCAEKVKADYLVTRDVSGFQRARIPHGTASEFMAFVFEKTKTSYALEQADEKGTPKLA